MMPYFAQQESNTTNNNISPSGVADRTLGIAMSYHNAGKASELPAGPDAVKSQSIPISGVHRTASELQLCEDEALADYRDFVFYSRIVNGISRQQERPARNMYLRQENDKCLAHIMSTRNSKGEPSFDGAADNRTPLHSFSHHIAQGMARTNVADDYYCGEEPPEGNVSTGYSSMMYIPQEEEEDEIFAMEL